MTGHHERRTTYTGHHVLDEHGDDIGRVVDVIYTDPTTSADGGMVPNWLVVDPGPLRAAHYVPIEGSYVTAGGQVVVPWDKRWVRSAPRANGDHLLSHDQITDLEQHYAGA